MVRCLAWFVEEYVMGLEDHLGDCWDVFGFKIVLTLEQAPSTSKFRTFLHFLATSNTRNERRTYILRLQ